MPPTASITRLADPAALARRQGWSEVVYRDLLALSEGRMSTADFDAMYRRTKAVLVLDITGFTLTTMHGGAINSFLRILDVHQICFPLLEEYGATLVRAFADDLVALFHDGHAALDAALEVHRRMDTANRASERHEVHPECCIGLGFGDVYEIGPNGAMGDEMNRASRLGEDIAVGRETLATEGIVAVTGGRDDVTFEAVAGDDLLFPYYRVTCPR